MRMCMGLLGFVCTSASEPLQLCICGSLRIHADKTKILWSGGSSGVILRVHPTVLHFKGFKNPSAPKSSYNSVNAKHKIVFLS